jgi:hypothetical protein
MPKVAWEAGSTVAKPRQELHLPILLVVMSVVPDDQPQFGRKIKEHENPPL